MISRRTFFGIGAAAALTGGVKGACDGEGAIVPPKAFSLGPKLNLSLPRADVKEPVRVFVIGDTHWGFHDARDDAYAANYKRMAQWPAPADALPKALKRAKDAKADLVVLVGDNLSFPTQANVDHLQQALAAGGVDWMYVAGNHDWHFEGLPGSDIAQRAEWAPKRLAPFYRGANPLMASRVVKGVRFVTIDNSVYHILPEQLAFWKAEAAKGDPIALFMHIPLWVEGWGLFTCGNPGWGAATDPYWQIEQREKWAEKQTPETFAFRDAVLATPNLVGVFTGHEHRLMAAQVRNQLMFSVPSNRDGSCLEVTIGGPQFS